MFSISSTSGTFTQETKDKLKVKKEELEESLEKNLSYIFTTYSYSYKGLKRLFRVVISYLDLITDTILLSSVLAAIVTLGLNFESQIALILTSSILFPLLLSSIMVASKRPLVILNAHQWKRLTDSKDKKAVLIARLAIIFLFPLVPAMVIISNQNAKDELKSLKRKYQEQGVTVTESALEECESLTKFINETRSQC